MHKVMGVLLQDGRFLCQATTGTFDKGLDLLVMPRGGDRALPAIAGLQVKGGDSQKRIVVGNHERYWADMPMPVFGVVVPASTDPMWIDLRSYLRAHPGVRSVKPDQPLATLPDALRAAYDEFSGLLSIIDLGSARLGRQLGALFALWPLLDREEVVALIRGRLTHLKPLATRFALELLVRPDAAGSAAELWVEELGALADSVITLQTEESAEATSALSEHPEDSWRWAATYLLDFVKRTGTAPGVLLAAAERSSPEGLDLLVHMAACLQPAASTRAWIRARPYLRDHREVQETCWALEDGEPLDFPRGP